MSTRTIKMAGLGVLCAAAMAIFVAPAQAAFNDPLFLLRPIPIFKRAASPPPTSTFEGPCGLAVDNAGQVYVSDYYHDTIDIFGANINTDNDNAGFDPRYGYVGQFADPDPDDGPCGIAVDGAGSLYVNEYHRSVVKIGTGVITGEPLNSGHPTGVAVDQASERLYVNDRTHISVFDLNGAPLGQIGTGSLIDSYGLAVSGFNNGGKTGRIYAPDAATNTVKVFEPTVGGTTPVATIDGSATPLGEFISLKDSAVAVDNTTGEVYIADNLEPEFAEEPETVIYVFSAAGAYEGRLKYSVIFGQSVGLAVDNSTTANQGRVYVTSGNTESGAVYGYPPHAAAEEAFPLPEPKQLSEEEEEPSTQSVGGGSVGGATVTSAAAASASPATTSGAAPVVSATSKSAKAKKARRQAKLHRKHRSRKGGKGT